MAYDVKLSKEEIELLIKALDNRRSIDLRFRAELRKGLAIPYINTKTADQIEKIKDDLIDKDEQLLTILNLKEYLERILHD